MSVTAFKPDPPAGDPFVHTALLYADAEQLRTTIGTFARDAAAAGEPLLAALPAHSDELLGDVLGDSGAGVTRLDAARAGGNPSRLLPAVRDWVGDQPGPVRMISETIWPGRGGAAVPECLRHEALVNVVFAGEPVNLICPFDAARLGGDVLEGARMTHPRLIDAAGGRASERFGDPLELARGENWPWAQPAPPVAELPFDGDLRALRHRLAEHDLLAGLDAGRREDLVFAVNEAASNAVRHGDGRCHARLWSDGDRIVCEITTASAIDDPLAGRRRPAPEATGGRGLWLINQLCDLVEIRSGAGGASVRMHVEAA